ncbi:YdcH family protein [Erythrobacter sp. LQ02-29]|uniref:YdcH family protein n=1 Tax=unclassified Erythrobacter TaxID=2633097 RepID=UPI001BFCC1CA|nr:MULTISPECIES: YdcH family protein [unclassified Erythrobacter]MCP9222233.1 YdcH family protein [Erythrobacter sp. LQ02-29]QWC56456.1 DUF465 domain-containing protein [Erythrobacter sp. 3-20A1M]
MNASHVSALKSKHAGIEAAIAQEMTRPAPDDAMLQRLKREKLRLKEELGTC